MCIPNDCSMKNFLLSTLLTVFALYAWAQPSKINHGLAFNPSLKPFYHGVASGDPLSNKVIIWTRVTPEADSIIHVKYYVATDTSFNNIVKSGETKTELNLDYTVKVDVDGLSPGTTYYYYFKAIGETSAIGRTKTVPEGDNINSNLKFAVVSCNNYEGGFFNAYGRISERHDIDAVIHLGDYIYEYKPGAYRSASLKNRSLLVPPNEIINEADYRLRYSLYRLDPDLQSVHQQHPFITIWDDHESANDSYLDGAENHTESTEGSWALRKAFAKKVYFEWMPIREHPNQKIYRKISYGSLMDLFMLDTRMEGRDKQAVHFDDIDAGRKMISQEQFNWLIDGMKASNAKWKVIGNQTIISGYNVGFAAAATGNPFAATNIDSLRKFEDNFNDDWRSYTTQRAAVIDSIKNKKINNVIIVTGDSHCSWAFDVTKTPALYPVAAYSNLPQPSPTYNRLSGAGSVAVEFGTPGISSQNFDEILDSVSALGFQYQINTAVKIPVLGDVYYNPHLKYVDLVQQGYMMLDIKKDSSQADFYYVNVKDSSSKVLTTGNASGKGARVINEQNKIKIINTLSPAKAILDIPAPGKRKVIAGVNENESLIAIFSLYPNPATNYVLLNYGVAHNATVETEILDANGKKVKRINKPASLSFGNYVQEIDVTDLKSGVYFVKITTNNNSVLRKLVVQ